MAKGIKTGGRKPGSPNKITRELKEMILQALEENGGVEYLKQRAIDNPASFLTLLGKVLPMQIAGDPESPVYVAHIERKIVKP